jgi:hypothetical protein
VWELRTLPETTAGTRLPSALHLLCVRSCTVITFHMKKLRRQGPVQDFKVLHPECFLKFLRPHLWKSTLCPGKPKVKSPHASEAAQAKTQGTPCKVESGKHGAVHGSTDVPGVSHSEQGGKALRPLLGNSGKGTELNVVHTHPTPAFQPWRGGPLFSYFRPGNPGSEQ